MMLTIEADEAWWPPTLTPEELSRTRLAWWTMLLASHSTRRCTDSRSSIEASDAPCAPGAATGPVSPCVALEQPVGVCGGGEHSALLERERIDLDQAAARAREQVTSGQPVAPEPRAVDRHEERGGGSHDGHVG